MRDEVCKAVGALPFDFRIDGELVRELVGGDALGDVVVLPAAEDFSPEPHFLCLCVLRELFDRMRDFYRFLFPEAYPFFIYLFIYFW